MQIHRVKAGKNIKPDASRKSSSSEIFIEYTPGSSATNQNIYNGAIEAVDGLGSTEIPTTTVAAPTTRAYNSPIFKKDPYLITQDILIVLNQYTPQGMVGLNALKTLITTFVDNLSITKRNDTIYQTRLSLASVTLYEPCYSVLGEFWEMNSSDIKNGLPNNGFSQSGNVDNEKVTLEKTSKSLQNQGVNLGIIGFNVQDLIDQDSRGNFVSTYDTNCTDETSVADFVNLFFFREKVPGFYNNWCPSTQTTDPSNATIIQEPSDYAGPTGSTEWSPTPQKARYCDFENKTYQILKSSVTEEDGIMKITVIYELEIEQDYLRFYEGSKEIESFTGVDVTGATFYSSASTLNIKFTSDNKGVFGGYYIKIEEKSN
ncbi:unnamed protein product [Caenorhabditis bovis]|uniref:CUB domain-containing protein n=1 Tax=Caenorhabditis bovis TaxID=2654633 RepID=A0A8S1EIF8_9PELO|nr:unnamed protein product [Caenorhabditis bovis]